MPKSIIDTISREKLNNLVVSSHSFYQVLQGIGYKQIYDDRTIIRVKEKCDTLKIDYSHLREDRFLEKIVCKECGKEFSFSELATHNNKIHHLCSTCKRKYQREYANNNINELNEYKKTLKCEKCGETRFYLLDFHHRNPDEKKFDISDRTNTKLKTIMPEINKCVVLCSNCHREFHYLNDKKNISLKEYLDA